MLVKPEFPAPRLSADGLQIHRLLPLKLLTGDLVALCSRLLFPPGDHQRILVRPGPVRAAAEARRLSGVHRAAHPGQQEGVHEERGQLPGHQRHREEAGALLRVNAHKEAVFPAQKVAESEVGCNVCWFYTTDPRNHVDSRKVPQFLFRLFSVVKGNLHAHFCFLSVKKDDAYRKVSKDAGTGTVGWRAENVSL